MKRKSISKIITMLIGTIWIGNTVPVSAESILDTIPLIETEKNHADDIQYSLLRGNNLNYGFTDISQLSSNEIAVTGMTQCHHVCDKVYLELYLEQKDGGSYYSYDSWEYSASDVSSMTRSLKVRVPRGYYYRLRGYHAAEDGSFEALSTITSGIWID